MTYAKKPLVSDAARREAIIQRDLAAVDATVRLVAILDTLCHTRHTFAEGGMARGLPPVPPKPVERSTFGTIYGKTCARCVKLATQVPGKDHGPQEG